MEAAATTSPPISLSRTRALAAAACALALFAASADAAERKAKSGDAHPAHAAKAHSAHKAKKPARIKFEKGGGETRAERDRRLQRECRGLPNAGACLGYGS
ncbi:MAG: hypothetical protein OJF60_001295 [Burkholderiaceae bacterium]|jgi:hypothetical protein|nr:MAG: hypothetical protein OJF60_001295 [Burkholderiaceae bacterium]